jgi:hypothetical protein
MCGPQPPSPLFEIGRSLHIRLGMAPGKNNCACKSLEKLSLEKVISCCFTKKPNLDWQRLPNVFHGVIWKSVHQRRFTTVLKELDLFFDETLYGRSLAAVCNGTYPYSILQNSRDWFDVNDWWRWNW